MKPLKFVVTLEDIDDLNMTKEERIAVNDRLKGRHTFGTNFKTAVLIFPIVVAREMENEECIINKFNYTVTHELIHVLLEDISHEINIEETAHGLSMILNDDIVSNRTFSGYGFYKRFNKHIEIVIEDTEDEEPQIEAQIPKAILTEAETVNANRNLSRERLRKFHETIS